MTSSSNELKKLEDLVERYRDQTNEVPSFKYLDSMTKLQLIVLIQMIYEDYRVCHQNGLAFGDLAIRLMNSRDMYKDAYNETLKTAHLICGQAISGLRSLR